MPRRRRTQIEIDRVRDIKREASRLISKESITATIPQAGVYSINYQSVDKSLSQGYLLKKGNPFDSLPVLKTVSARHKTVNWENERTPHRTRVINHGPVRQIVKDGKRVEQ